MGSVPRWCVAYCSLIAHRLPIDCLLDCATNRSALEVTFPKGQDPPQLWFANHIFCDWSGLLQYPHQFFFCRRLSSTQLGQKVRKLAFPQVASFFWIVLSEVFLDLWAFLLIVFPSVQQRVMPPSLIVFLLPLGLLPAILKTKASSWSVTAAVGSLFKSPNSWRTSGLPSFPLWFLSYRRSTSLALK